MIDCAKVTSFTKTKFTRENAAHQFISVLAAAERSRLTSDELYDHNSRPAEQTEEYSTNDTSKSSNSFHSSSLFQTFPPGLP